MNSSIKTHCSRGINAIHRFASSCDAAMSGYRRSMEIAKNAAKKFKDEDGYIQEQRIEHAAKARAQIHDADKELAECMKEVQAELRKVVAEHIAMPPRKEFLDLLRAYKDFSVPITRGELDALIRSAGGNYFSQRALFTVAQANGWEITCPDADEYAKTLDSFNQILEPPFSYAGSNFSDEASEVYGLDKDTKNYGVVQRRPDGSTYRAGYPLSWMYLHSQQTGIEGAAKKLEQISEEWGRDFVPSIVAYKEELKKAGFNDAAADMQAEVMQAVDTEIAAERVQVKDDAAVRIAERIGKLRADADAKSKEILAAYGAN